MISFFEALYLLKQYGLESTRIIHSIGVSDFALKLAERIKERHSELGIDPSRVRIAALLHDIGRSREGNHVVNSVAILKEEGLEEIAGLTVHGVAYEQMKAQGIDDPSLLPGTVENKIVAYADTRFRLVPVTLEQRISELRVRRKNEKTKLASVETAIPRMRALERELLELAGEEEEQ